MHRKRARHVNVADNKHFAGLGDANLFAALEREVHRRVGGVDQAGMAMRCTSEAGPCGREMRISAPASESARHARDGFQKRQLVDRFERGGIPHGAGHADRQKRVILGDGDGNERMRKDLIALERLGDGFFDLVRHQACRPRRP